MPQELYNHPARVTPVNTIRDRLLEVLHQREVQIPTEDELFFFEAEISNDRLDSYFTHMSEGTLRNYAEDAARGVAFLRGHNVRELPLGYSLTGEVSATGDRQRVLANFYTVRGLPETDDLIRRMQTGLLRDVSVGFSGGRMVCDICHEEFWDCRHFPGLKYEEMQGDTVRTLLSTYTIEDARLNEVSGVFDGATPDAMILKAQRAAQAGDLSPEQIHVLEQRYRVALPVSRSFPAAKPDVAPEVRKETTMNYEEMVVNIRTSLGVVTDEEVLPGLENLRSRLEAANQRVKELEPQAVDGAQYREDLVNEALTEGVRAQGDGFDRELYESTLRSAPLALIKRMRDDWKKLADALLPAGRTSVNSDTRVAPKVDLIPDEAYR